MDDPNEVLYYEFRTVFGVVIAYIAGYLMHYRIEISLAMHEKDGGCEFVNTGNFIHWSADGAKFEFTDGANDTNYDPDVMKYITPFNFFRVRWNEFKGIVTEVVTMFRGKNWATFAAETYRRTNSRFNYLRRPWVRSLRMLWRGYKTDLCLGMARSAGQRKSIEKGDPPYDFLMETRGGHRIEHATSPGNPWQFTHPELESWDLQDVFPSSPDTFMYDLPQTERELRERQNPKKRKGTAEKGKGDGKKAKTAGATNSSQVTARATSSSAVTARTKAGSE